MYEQSNTSAGGNPFTSAANNALWSLQGRNSSSPSGPLSSSPAAIPQNIFTNPAIQPSSVINLSNSTDVVIGPMTQYQGPVTIYQYMDATVEARSMQANGGINQSKTVKHTCIARKLTRTPNMIILLVIVVVIVVGAVLIYKEVHRNQIKKENAAILFGNNYEHGTFQNLGNGHLVVDRLQWGASNAAKQLTVPLEHLIPYVLITHIGVQFEPCLNFYQCSIAMRGTQDSAIAEKNLPDINSNFYVGDDGNVYVGRGWDWANTYANKSLSVSFMGDYGRYIPSDKQVEATKFLLAYGVTNNYLQPDYKLVAHNQTKNTKSPGANVYRIIKTWPHFYDCSIDGKVKCGSDVGLPAVWNGQQ